MVAAIEVEEAFAATNVSSSHSIPFPCSRSCSEPPALAPATAGTLASNGCHSAVSKADANAAPLCVYLLNARPTQLPFTMLSCSPGGCDLAHTLMV